MALIKCPNCGKEISEKAMKCPNCGVSISRMQKMQFAFDRQPRIYKIIIGIIIAIGGVASFLPIFIENVYEPLGVFYYGDLWNKQRTPEFCLTIGVALIGTLIPLCMFAYILVQRRRKKAVSWICWPISLTIAVVAPFLTYYCWKYACDCWGELYAQKVSAADGTYRWETKDGLTVTIGMKENGDVLFMGEGFHKEGQITNIYYDYATDRFGIEYKMDDEFYLNWYDADMKFVSEGSAEKIPVKIICRCATEIKYNKGLWGVPEQE